MLIYVNNTNRQTDNHIKSIVPNLTKCKVSLFLVMMVLQLSLKANFLCVGLGGFIYLGQLFFKRGQYQTISISDSTYFLRKLQNQKQERILYGNEKEKRNNQTVLEARDIELVHGIRVAIDTVRSGGDLRLFSVLLGLSPLLVTRHVRIAGRLLALLAALAGFGHSARSSMLAACRLKWWITRVWRPFA